MNAKVEGADAVLGGEVDGVASAARHPDRRVGLLERLGDDVAGRHGDERAGVAGERLLGEAAQRDAQPFLPHGALVVGVDEEAAELRLRGGLPGAELDPPTGDQVEGRDPLGDAGRVVEGRGCLHDPVAEAQVLRALRHRGEEHLGCAGVRVLLEEVVLDLPDASRCRAIGELALLERVLEQLVLGLFAPGSGQLMLVEEAEPHPARLWGTQRVAPTAWYTEPMRSSQRSRLSSARA